MNRALTEQEQLWSGSFGDAYNARNSGPAFKARALAFLTRALQRAQRIRSVIEYGANIGHNLDALEILLPGAEQAAIEINPDACDMLDRNRWNRRHTDKKRGRIVYCKSILDFAETRSWDLVLCKGVLIHQDPGALPQLYDSLYEHCSRYILIAEYYSPTPVTIRYRGLENALFKRDFAGELMDRHHDLVVADYGFVWRRDPIWPEDDINFWLLERR